MPHEPITVRAGQFEFLKLNTADRDLRDMYHWMLTLSWPWFSTFIFGVYLAINLLFALLYYAESNCIGEMPPHSFGSAFFFSVETLATVGYGHMYPATFYGHFVTTIEIMTGMFGLAVMTGLIFVRFSRPTARVLFSQTAVVSPFNGQPALMIRVGNLRHQALVEAEFRMMFSNTVGTLEDSTMRRFYTLKLDFDRVIMFPAAMTIRHIITEESPLHGLTEKDWQRTEARVIASVVGVDTVIQASVQSQQDYSWREIRHGHRFVEIYTEAGASRVAVDYGRLHETEAAPV